MKMDGKHVQFVMSTECQCYITFNEIRFFFLSSLYSFGRRLATFVIRSRGVCIKYQFIAHRASFEMMVLLLMSVAYDEHKSFIVLFCAKRSHVSRHILSHVNDMAHNSAFRLCVCVCVCSVFAHRHVNIDTDNRRRVFYIHIHVLYSSLYGFINAVSILFAAFFYYILYFHRIH